MLSTFLQQQGFKVSSADSSFFVHKTSALIILILVYVDDILATGSGLAAITSLFKVMSAKFAMKDLGSLHYFLGLEVQHATAGYLLHQTKYAKDLLVKAAMVDCKPYTTPTAAKSSTSSTVSSSVLPDPSLYRSLVGALQFLTITRPNIQFAVNSVCQHMHAPTPTDFAAGKRILHYIKGTLGVGLQFTSGPFSSLLMLMLTGLVILFIAGPLLVIAFFLAATWLISWCSKK